MIFASSQQSFVVSSMQELFSTVEERNVLDFINTFYPRDTMRKRGFRCRKMSVCLSVYLTGWLDVTRRNCV